MKKQQNRKKRIVFFSVMAVFVLAMSIWMGTLLKKNADLDAELAQKEAESDEWQEKNAALAALVDEENETALMEEYARKSGYVYSDERVYINGS